MHTQHGNLGVSKSNPRWKLLLQKARIALANGAEIEIDPRKIRQLKGQPRTHFNEESIDRLADSIEEIGQVQSGIVRKVTNSGIHEFELIDGERRWRATLKRGLKYRAKVITIDDESLPFVIAAVANFNREDHTSIEVSDAIEKMLSLGIPIQETAKVFGLSVIWAGQIHLLQKLHPDVREMLNPNRPKRKILPLTAAIKIARMEKSLQVKTALDVLAKKVTLARLRKEVLDVSKAAGKHIRLYHRKPYRRWATIERNVRLLIQKLDDIRHELGEKDMTGIIKDKRRNVEDVLTNFETIVSSASSCAEQIRDIRG